MPDVALATAAALPGLHSDDRLLLTALRSAGWTADPVVWEDAYFDWTSVRLCVVRSAWDYAYRRPTFLAWAESVAAATELWNPLHVVRWNTHKRYLCDLGARGVPVVPTVVLPAGSSVSLAELLGERGWVEGVMKAAVGQAGRYAARVRPDDDAAQRRLERLLPHEDMLLQPFLERVRRTGELSMVFVDGRFTHAVRKRSPGDEFRVHDDYGGTVVPDRPTPGELEVAERAVRAVDTPLLYARVDLVPDRAGEPCVMELELVEPELFFRFSDDAVRAFVAGVTERIGAA